LAHRIIDNSDTLDATRLQVLQTRKQKNQSGVIDIGSQIQN